MTTVIDSHQHFWQRSLPFDYALPRCTRQVPIARDHLPEESGTPLIKGKLAWIAQSVCKLSTTWRKTAGRWTWLIDTLLLRE